MKRGTDHILTTHTGSLPRPADLVDMLYDKDQGKTVDNGAFEGRVRSAVSEVVAKQVATGIAVVNDGEAGKVAYSTYVKDRLSGFEGPPIPRTNWWFAEFPDYYARSFQRSSRKLDNPSCNGPISSRDLNAVQRDIANLAAAAEQAKPEDLFMTAASPGVISLFLGNSYYKTYEEYLFAISAAMRPEYQAIARAGFTLQVDSPDMAFMPPPGSDLAEHRKLMEMRIEALNQALEGIPPEQLRMHLCWGNYEGPHTHDVPLRQIIDLVFTARPNGISFEGANPRHAHEWTVFEEVKLPEGKLIIPGVIDSTTNYVEHPMLVAQRILNYARLVGRENVIAGTDCGLATSAGSATIDPRIAWAKLQSLAEGARLASESLFG